MIMKAALTTVAAAALCLPVMAPGAASSEASVANVAYVSPASFADLAFPMRKKCRSAGLVNVSCNTVQVPIQACNNNVLSNINIGILSKNQSSKSKNSGDCKQKNSSN